MATKDISTMGNIYDVLKMKAPNGSPIDSVVNTLIETDDWSLRTPARPANGGLTNHGLRTTGLPTSYVVDIGGSWKESKSQREPFTDGLVTLRSTYQAPKDTFTSEEPAVGQALLAEEKKNHVIAMNQAAMNMLLRGSNSTTKVQGDLVGILERKPYTVIDSIHTFDVGGTGLNLRHALLVKPGIATVHSLYNPFHPTLGIEQEDKGEIRVDGLGTSDDEHRYDICVEFAITRGICIRDLTALKLLANIPVAAADNPGADLVDAAIEASIIAAPKNNNSSWILYLDERAYAKLVKAQNDKTFVYTSANNIWRTELPMIGTNIVLARMDALNKVLGSGETQIT